MRTARQKGSDLVALAKQMLTESLPPVQTTVPQVDEENATAIAQLKLWMSEEATDDPEEIRQAEEELAEFKRNINANRAATGERQVYL